jgi:hypothetical protein
MNASENKVCLHCELREPCSERGLCQVCHARKPIRVLYLRRRGWTPEWEAHLQRLTRRARLKLPLFDEPEGTT